MDRNFIELGKFLISSPQLTITNKNHMLAESNLMDRFHSIKNKKPGRFTKNLVVLCLIKSYNREVKRLKILIL